MDHLLRNSENRGAGRLRSPRLPTLDLLSPQSGARARVREAEYRWTALKRCIIHSIAKVYTKHTS